MNAALIDTQHFAICDHSMHVPLAFAGNVLRNHKN